MTAQTDTVVNGHATDAQGAAADPLDKAWRHFAEALINEAEGFASACVTEMATHARGRIATDLSPEHRPSVTDALVLGATIGIVSSVVLVPRMRHDR